MGARRQRSTATAGGLLALASLLSLAVCQPAAAPAAAAQAAAGAAAWDRFNQQRSTLLLNGQPVGDELGAGVLGHQFTTPLAQVQASNTYTAANARYRRVVNDLRNGRPVKVVALGGLATNGSDATAPGRNDYFAMYVAYLARAFPRAQINAVRSSVGVAPSAVLAQCLDNYLPADADLVLLEMTANDGVFMDDSIIFSHNSKAYELVMRRVMQLRNQPALILTQTMVPGMGSGQRPFYLTPEAPAYAALASFYGTPVVSMRNALWRSGTPSANGMIRSADVAANGATPLDSGHRAITDALVFLTQRTAQDLLLLPYGDYDRNAMARDLPPTPVYSDVSNNPGSVVQNSTCFWLRNATGEPDRRCPTRMGQMCNFDYSSNEAFLRGWSERADLSEEKPSNSTAVLIGAIVGGVVGGLLLLGGLLALCIHRKKKQQARIHEQMEAKLAQRKLNSSGSGAAGSGPAAAANGSSAVPITATSAAAAHNV